MLFYKIKHVFIRAIVNFYIKGSKKYYIYPLARMYFLKWRSHKEVIKWQT